MGKYFVHETSIVDDNVKIGDGTKIWHPFNKGKCWNSQTS